ncbi:MAG: hypothetical protein ACI9HK_001697 [Pirellulaceae bacterium]|jgi:hypothetical protein
MSAITREQKNSAAPLVSTRHELLIEMDAVQPFADWLDHKLNRLEEKYRADWTKQSIKNSLVSTR